MAKKTGKFDYYLFLIIMCLLLFGLVMVFSASSPMSLETYGNSYHVVIRQFMWAVLGFGIMIFLSQYDYHKLGKYSFAILIICFILLAAVLVVGQEVKGAKRWLGVGGATMQPSEFAKFAMIVFLSFSVSKNADKLKNFGKGLFPYLLLVGAVCGMVLLEKHLSGTVVVAGVSMLILFIGGAKFSHFVCLGGLAGAAGVAAIALEPYRMERIVTFMDPFKYKMDEGWQIIQSLYAIGSGGIFGLGLGQSRQKYLYIPEPQNDFIFSIICEELGFIGAALVIVLFILLIWRGAKIAMTAPDKFGSLLAFGFTGLIAIQVLINIAVVTSSMPVTGMQLPFFSAGGSSLVFIMAGMGVLLNVSKQCKKG